MPDLAQVVLALKVQHGIDLGLKLNKLDALYGVVSSAIGSKFLPWQPVVGENIFAHESGIHANGSLKNGSTFEPFPPELLGKSRRIVVGKHSGRAGVSHALKSSGISVNDDSLTNLLRVIREVSIVKGGALTYGQVVQIYNVMTALGV